MCLDAHSSSGYSCFCRILIQLGAGVPPYSDYAMGRTTGFQFLAGAGKWTFLSHGHHIQTISGAHPAPYPLGTGGSFTGIKARA